MEYVGDMNMNNIRVIVNCWQMCIVNANIQLSKGIKKVHSYKNGAKKPVTRKFTDFASAVSYGAKSANFCETGTWEQYFVILVNTMWHFWKQDFSYRWPHFITIYWSKYLLSKCYKIEKHLMKLLSSKKLHNSSVI